MSTFAFIIYYFSTWEDLGKLGESFNKRQYSEESGGVINLLDPARIKYVNRIRHAGLGGLEYYDNMFMTVNERYIVVNTKTGNLVAEYPGNGSRIEGLFIIDLEEHIPCLS